MPVSARSGWRGLLTWCDPTTCSAGSMLSWTIFRPSRSLNQNPTSLAIATPGDKRANSPTGGNDVSTQRQVRLLMRSIVGLFATALVWGYGASGVTAAYACDKPAKADKNHEQPAAAKKDEDSEQPPASEGEGDKDKNDKNKTNKASKTQKASSGQAKPASGGQKTKPASSGQTKPAS